MMYFSKLPPPFLPQDLMKPRQDDCHGLKVVWVKFQAANFPVSGATVFIFFPRTIRDGRVLRSEDAP